MTETPLTRRLLAQIADPTHTKNSVALLYAEAIRAGMDAADWPVVNHAIMRRWSVSALQYIKKLAWKTAYPPIGDNSVQPSPPTREAVLCEQLRAQCLRFYDRSPMATCPDAVDEHGRQWCIICRAADRLASFEAEALTSRADPLQVFAERLAQSQEDLPADAARVLREHLPELYIDAPAPPALSGETPKDERKNDDHEGSWPSSEFL